MPKMRCACGAKYRFPETSIGHRARCRKCGAIFTLEPQGEGGLIPIADHDGMMDEAAAAAREATVAAPKQGEVYVPPGSPAALVSAGIGRAPAISMIELPGKGYISDVLWTFLFPSSPGNLVAFLVFWVAMVIGQFVRCVPMLGFFLWLLVLGWYCAYLFEVLSAAANGERDLPELPSPQYLIDVVEPLLKWIGSWLIVFVPAIAYMILTWGQNGITAMDLLPMMMGGIAGLLGGSSSGAPDFDLLVYAGTLCWPMVVLCVAMGGFTTLYRLDLILWTVIKTLPLYLLTLGLMFAAAFAEVGIMKLAGGGLASQVQSGQASVVRMLGGGLVLAVLAMGVDIYLDIVLMRLIGLYYYHFKDRFAFSCG